MVEKLCTVLDIPFSSMKTKEVETAILEHDEDFHFTYDTVQRKLVDIQTIP